MRSLIGLVWVEILIALAVTVACGSTDGQEAVQAPTPSPERIQGDRLRNAPELASAPSAHAEGEGILLGKVKAQETVFEGGLCDPRAPVREYKVVAVNVAVTLNRYLDYDPEGRIYVLKENLALARAEEGRNRDARARDLEPAVSLGLQGDAIEPLILRVNQGECLRVELGNGLEDGEFVSFHLHGSSLYVAETGAAAIATNPDSLVGPESAVVYEWMVAKDEPEGTHYFHSHGDDRLQTGHGLFGAVIVEPEGSRYLDPIDGSGLRSGWAAVIQDPNGSDFREFAIVYHEIGNESFRVLNRDGEEVPQVDPFTTAYRPASRAINYRSEPFMNRLQLQLDTTGVADMSQAYSSYVFGDPATPIARSYLGDPVKQRLIHGGSEVFHVHHVHGGAIRWRRQPETEPTAFDTGLDKHPPLLPQASERIDSQSVGPSETYDIEHECGSGGCQQSVGDFLIHCHVAHHYIAGMWMIWRVYNTRQDDQNSLDSLPSLLELPDRLGQIDSAVTSEGLIGRTVSSTGQAFEVDRDNIGAWVERQLPPQGEPKGYDASVLDWQRQGDLYLGEYETAHVWPGYRSPTPGVRPPLPFDPRTGKLAYPFLRPHLGIRPPFAPNHGPAPFLEPISGHTGPGPPGANGLGGLCPIGTELRQFVIHAITLPIAHNPKDIPNWGPIVDRQGEIFVLKEEEAAVRADNNLRVPLAVRANAGEHCVDVVLKSELRDRDDRLRFSKVNIHIHFVQFDIQASDGVNTGFNYEQSVRPFAEEGETLSSAAPAGIDAIALGDAQRFQSGTLVGVGMDQDTRFEIRRIKHISGNTLTFDSPLEYDHARGEFVSSEFVRYRWYPDVQFGTAYFHDHVNALSSWKHGLFGALISEPPGSTYHDPRSGAEIRSGPLADIHTDAVVSADMSGSFRELVMFIQDQHPTLQVTQASGSAFNLRIEPLPLRGGDPSRLFSTRLHGDPATPILEAYVGDPVVVRTLVGATNEVHTWHVDGHWFRVEPFSLTSRPVNTVHLGISERYDLFVPRAGGPQGLSGDYLYYNGRTSRLKEGSWGIVRVYDHLSAASLKTLPGHESVQRPRPSVCPRDAPIKKFDVAAIEVSLPMLGGSDGKIYVLQEDKQAVGSGSKSAEPLVLHVNVGDCVEVDLSNETDVGKVSFHVDMLAFDPLTSYGVEAGLNPEQAIAPGETRSYTYYAHPEVGETVALVTDWGNVLENPRLGLYGAIIVGPKGSRYADPTRGRDVTLSAGWRVNVYPEVGPGYRDFTLFIQDEDDMIGTAGMPYPEHVDGVVGLNYRAAALRGRRWDPRGPSGPETPLLEAYAGDPVKIHVLVPFSAQSHVFTIEGHQWPFEPGRAGTDLLSSAQVGGTETLTIELAGGAGGRSRLAGDYLYGDHREPYREAGLWGLFRVYHPGDTDAKLRPLADR